MPTTRRKSNNPHSSSGGTSLAANKAQSTLSFNNKSARISKPTTTTGQDATIAAKKAKLSEPARAQLVDATSIPQPEPEDDTAVEIPEPDTTEELKKDENVDKPEKREEQNVKVTIRSPPHSPVVSRKPKRKSGPSSTSLIQTERELEAEKVTDAKIKKYWKAEEDSRLAPRVHQSHLSLHEKILRHFDLSSQYGPCIGIPRLMRWKRANGLGLEPPLEVLAVLLREENKSTSQGCGKMAYIDELGAGKAVLVD